MIRLDLTPEQRMQSRSGSITLTEKQARTVRGKLTAAAGAGRKPSTDRCPCGAMTAARAAARGHQCETGAGNVKAKGRAL
jgi:hypothetical protein